MSCLLVQQICTFSETSNKMPCLSVDMMTYLTTCKFKKLKPKLAPVTGTIDVGDNQICIRTSFYNLIIPLYT